MVLPRVRRPRLTSEVGLAVLLASSAVVTALLGGLAARHLGTADDRWAEAERKEIQRTSLGITLVVSAFDDLAFYDDMYGAARVASTLNARRGRTPADYRIETGARARFAATLIAALKSNADDARVLHDPEQTAAALRASPLQPDTTLEFRRDGDRASDRAIAIAITAVVATIGFLLAALARVVRGRRELLAYASCAVTSTALVATLVIEVGASWSPWSINRTLASSASSR